MPDYLVFDADDFGCNHIISDQCQSRDCRDALDKLHYANPNFKITLFAVPGEMTPELLNWCETNNNWIELAVHGFYHISNYECSKMTYEQFDEKMGEFTYISRFFTNGFKAPGWQISDEVYYWLLDHKFWVADQPYNDNRRPKDLPVYKVGDNSVHLHTWNCMGNGIYELMPDLLEKIKDVKQFKFISEVV